MSKLGGKQFQKVVPKVYKGLQSYLSQLPGLGQVGHPPKGTSGHAGTLDWGPMWSGPSPLPQVLAHACAPMMVGRVGNGGPWWLMSSVTPGALRIPKEVPYHGQ